MTLLGLGILVVSLTCFVFQVPISSWGLRLERWRRKEMGAGGAARIDPHSTDREKEKGKEKEGSSAQEERARPARTGSESSRSDPPTPSGSSTQRAMIESLGKPKLPHIKQSPQGPLRNMLGPQKNLSASPTTEAIPIPSINPPTTSAAPSPTNPPPKPSSRPAQPTATASATLMPPPTRPISKSPSSLMPPPQNKTASALRALPKSPSYLDPPPSAAANLRLPPARLSLSPSPTKTNSTPPSTSTLAPSSRPSRKVILTPGHSPLDWAALTAHPPTPTYLRGSQLPPHLIKVPPSVLKQQNGRKGRDAWSTWQGKVYNLSPYMDFHPGGKGELMRGVGKAGEAERLFKEVHAWVNWEGILGECLVGVLVSEAEGRQDGGGELEDMD